MCCYQRQGGCKCATAKYWSPTSRLAPERSSSSSISTNPFRAAHDSAVLFSASSPSMFAPISINTRAACAQQHQITLLADWVPCQLTTRLSQWFPSCMSGGVSHLDPAILRGAHQRCYTEHIWLIWIHSLHTAQSQRLFTTTQHPSS